MAGDCKGDEHVGSWKFIEEYLRNLQVKQAIILSEGLSGRKEGREPKVRVSKISRKDKRVESQSKGTEKRILIP